MSVDGERSLFFQLGWTLANLRLRWTRSLLTVCGVGIAVALLVSVASFYGGYRGALRRGIEQLGFEVLVTAKGCPYEAATMFLKGGNIPMYLDEAIRDAVISDPAVLNSTRLFLQTVSGEEGRHYMFLGVDDEYRAMKPWLTTQVGDWFTGEHALEVVLGYNVATELGVVPGEVVDVPGVPQSLTVVGILDRTGAQDDGTLFLPLATAQRIFGRKDRLTGIGIKVREVTALPDYLSRLYELPAVQVVTLSQAQGVLLGFMVTARNLLGSVAAMTALVAVLALLNTLSMALLERRRELAVLRAMGARGAFLFRTIVIESAFLAALGGMLGVGLAFGGRGTVETFLREWLPFAPQGTILRIELSTVLLALTACLAIGVLCALYPAWQAARLKPYRVMREAE